MSSDEELLFVRCHGCGGTLVYKRNGAEIEVFHDCTPQSIRDTIERLSREIEGLRQATAALVAALGRIVRLPNSYPVAADAANWAIDIARTALDAARQEVSHGR